MKAYVLVEEPQYEPANVLPKVYFSAEEAHKAAMDRLVEETDGAPLRRFANEKDRDDNGGHDEEFLYDLVEDEQALYYCVADLPCVRVWYEMIELQDSNEAKFRRSLSEAVRLFEDRVSQDKHAEELLWLEEAKTLLKEEKGGECK